MNERALLWIWLPLGTLIVGKAVAGWLGWGQHKARRSGPHADKEKRLTVCRGAITE